MTRPMPPKAQANVARVFKDIMERRVNEQMEMAREMYKSGSTWPEISEATGWNQTTCEHVIFGDPHVSYRIVWPEDT